jgi:hypothetical protein
MCRLTMTIYRPLTLSKGSIHPTDLGRSGSTRASSTSATHPTATDDGTAALPSWRMAHTSPSLLTPAASLVLKSSTHNQLANSTHPSGGTCPSDGLYNGTGGSSSCSGCLTYNNALNAASRLSSKTLSTTATRDHPSSTSLMTSQGRT